MPTPLADFASGGLAVAEHCVACLPSRRRGRCYIRHVFTHAEHDARDRDRRQAARGRPRSRLSPRRPRPEAPAMSTPTPGVDPAYLELIHRFPLRPLRSDADYAVAVLVMNDLIDAERSPGQDDYLHVLGTLIGEYDDEHYPIEDATPGAILRGFLDDRKVSQAELARATGIKEGNISAMLKDQRGIGKNARAAFAQFFGVEPTDFVVE